jgi:uncharacterized protein
MSHNHCGECNACCRVFEIPEINKPAGKWCEHCAISKGCTIYEDRPSMCVEFECLWLLSQRRMDPHEQLGPELRPDRCKVVFSPSTNDQIMAATTMPGSPDAWRKPKVRALISTLVKGGGAVVAGSPRSTRRVMIDVNGPREVYMTEPDENGMQWNIPTNGATR